MEDIDPLGIFLVKSGSKGDKLLFRYPFDEEEINDRQKKSKKRSSYAKIDDVKNEHNRPTTISNIENGKIQGFPNKVLSNLFAVKNGLGDKKFEMKINDIRFVGHPSLLHHDSSPLRSEVSTKRTINLINIVFALRANASHSVVDSYHTFSQRLVVALKHEELSCGYVSAQAKIMTNAHDEVNSLTEDCQVPPFQMILRKSQLAHHLQTVFQDLIEKGEVHIKINFSIEVSFCLPQKVHRLRHKMSVLPEAIQDCLTALRPYHGVLLMENKQVLLDALPLDASPDLIRFIVISSPSKCLQTIAADIDLTLNQVFQLVGHLMSWAKAIIIYPLCESNVYMLSPHAPTHIASPLMANFTRNFPGVSLLAVMSDFSLPTSLSEWNSPSKIQYQSQYVHIMVWMLQHRLLIQLHTYIYLIPRLSSPSVICPTTPTKNTDAENQASLHSRNESVKSVTSSDDLSESFNNIKLSESVDSAITSPLENDMISEPSMRMYKRLHSVSLSNISAAEREAILRSPAAQSQDDVAKFSRLLPYFNGEHHLEQIMYHENVKRSYVHAVLDKFRDILVTCQHEDVAVASFYRCL